MYYRGSNGRRLRVAYARAADIVRLALRLQGTWRGLTLDDIQRDFEVARRTAERLRDAVEDVFGPLELVGHGERRHHWRLRTSTLRSLVTVSAEELAELAAAATALERNGLQERASMVSQLADKLRALLEADALKQIEPDLQALMVAEGLAMRPGPRPRLDDGLLALLRDAIKNGRVVAFDYVARATGQRNRRRVQPYGVIYGNRAFLVGHTDRGSDLRLWRLANISGAEVTREGFTRDPTFDLQQFARAVVRDLPGGAGTGSAAVRRGGGTGRGPFRVPPRPERHAQSRWLADGALHGRRPRRDLLAPGHLGHPRERRAAGPPAATDERHVRRPRRPPRHLIRQSPAACRHPVSRFSGFPAPARPT